MGIEKSYHSGESAWRDAHVINGASPLKPARRYVEIFSIAMYRQKQCERERVLSSYIIFSSIEQFVLQDDLPFTCFDFSYFLFHLFNISKVQIT